MDTILIAVFPSEAQARKGVTRLRALDREAAITLYAKALITKEDPWLVTVRDAAEQGPLGAAVALFTGSLLGLLGGPVGFVVAASAGRLGSILFDLAKLGVTEEFPTDVGRALRPGSTAVVAEIWEQRTHLVDKHLGEASAVVFRRTRGAFVDACIEADVNALREELGSLRNELAVANHEHTTDLEARTGTIMAGLRSSQQRAKTLLDLVVEEGEAKMRLLERKVADARGRRRALLNARLAEIRIRYRNRAEKLRATWVRAEQALARA